VANPKRDTNHRHARVRAATIIARPWGRELCYASEPQYEAKVLEVKKDHSLNPEHNEYQTRTMHILSGAVWFQLNGLEFDLIPGACLTIRPGDSHSLQALEDSIVLVVSTPLGKGEERADASGQSP
jgi:quercetin dioxygenase-like cupin family protein